MNKLALLVSRGSHNNLAQIATLVMSAALSGIVVSVLFRDEAVKSLTRTNCSNIPLSSIYSEEAEAVRDRYRKARMDNIKVMLQEAKEEGDVKLYACTSSMFVCGVEEDDLIPEIDEPRGLVSFLLEEMEEADHVLTF